METSIYCQIAEAAAKVKAAADRLNGSKIAINIPSWVQEEILADAVAAAEALDAIQTVDQRNAEAEQFSRLTLEVRRLENACRDKNAQIRVLQERLFCAACEPDTKASQGHTNAPNPPQGTGDRVAYVDGYNAGVHAQRVAEQQHCHREPCD